MVFGETAKVLMCVKYAYLVGVPEFRVSYLNSGTLNGVDIFGCNFGAAAATTLVQITHCSWHAFGSVSGSI